MLEVLMYALIDFGIYSLLVLIYTVVGAYQNINVFQMKFDWRIYVNGLVKWLMLGFAIVGTVFASFLLLNQATIQGVEIVNAQAVAPRVLLATVLLACAYMVGKIVSKLGLKLGLSEEDVKKIQEVSVNTDPDKPLVFELNGLPMPSADYLASKVRDEFEGGVGAYYTVPISSYAAFKAAVNGNGYDVDNYYGYQCWDGAALVWQQLGRSLITGNGLAIGCWDLKRDANKGNDFDLVTNVNSLKLGDVVVMRPNHIGFFDGYDGDYMRILGQNQGGVAGPNGGAKFNITRVHKNTFAGAFRLKRWNTVTPAPAPTPTPAPVAPARKSNEEIAREVLRGDWGNLPERRTRLIAAGYNYDAIQAIVNKGVAPATPPANTDKVKVGDTVVPLRRVSYDGVALTQYDQTYTVTEVKGNRVVLSARGAVWAAMNLADIRKA